MNFLFLWLIHYVFIMFAMSVDNIFWIPTSPEYSAFKKMGWIKRNPTLLIMKEGTYYTKLDYILKYRIWTVLTHWRDIIPAIITSLLITIVGLFLWSV